MKDLISRQEAIDEILAVTGNSSVRELYEHVQEHGLSDMWSGGVNAAIDIIIAVPPAQPETHDKRMETHACDCISRQAAIDALYKMLHDCFWADDEELDAVITTLNDLPSVQPEMIKEIRKWINSGNRGNADYFIVEKIEEIINKYE